MADPPPPAPSTARPNASAPPRAGAPDHLEVTMPRPIRTPRTGGAR